MVFVKLIGYLNRSIEYLFYSLFLLVPLVFAGNTSELFEFNKMWLTFGITILIGFFWFSKMIISKQLIFRRTIFDIPILLFLISQVVSTIISLDPHISLWGYYSRWNGGLLSTITYIFLFYAFISNFSRTGGEGDKGAGSLRNFRRTANVAAKRVQENFVSDLSAFSSLDSEQVRIVKNSLIVSIISGFLVVLWALPSHFGYDPTCLIFRGELNVSCWTQDFQPRVRIFGPLGQPDWLAGYLSVILPITGVFILNALAQTKKLSDPRFLFYALSFLLFYLSLLYTGSRSGIAGTILALVFFFITYAFLNRKNLDFVKNKFVPVFVGLIFLISFLVGIQVPILNKFSLSQVQKNLQRQSAPTTPTSPTAQTQARSQQPEASSQELGGSDSLKIRKIVWRGAVDVWRANPIIGTGVETFAFAYYKYRPVEHNSLSEWNFLYNKAHNEYLNYLATTGIFGLGTYLLFIGLFLIVALVNLLNIKLKEIKYIGPLTSEKWDNKDPLLLGLLSSFLAILMINFFGFSVVILNIYLFLIPAFVLILLGFWKSEKLELAKNETISYSLWTGVFLIFLLGAISIFFLIKFWIADTKYALGFNYNRAKEYQIAYPLLQGAVDLRKEPVFEDELSINKGVLAVGLASQNATQSAEIAEKLASESLATSDRLVRDHPNNIIFWKSRVRLLYTLSNLNPDFLPKALDAIRQTSILAPTDASVLYNLGVLYGQNNDSKKAVEVLEKTVEYKPDYKDAHFALGLFYHDLSINDKGKVIDTSYHQKSIDRMRYILKNLSPNDTGAKESLDLWEKER